MSHLSHQTPEVQTTVLAAAFQAAIEQQLKQSTKTTSTIKGIIMENQNTSSSTTEPQVPVQSPTDLLAASITAVLVKAQPINALIESIKQLLQSEEVKVFQLLSEEEKKVVFKQILGNFGLLEIIEQFKENDQIEELVNQAIQPSGNLSQMSFDQLFQLGKERKAAGQSLEDIENLITGKDNCNKWIDELGPSDIVEYQFIQETRH